MKIEIKGMESLNRKLAAMTSGFAQSAAAGVKSALDDTAKVSMRLAPGKVKKAIRVEMLDERGNVIEGRVFNDTALYPWSSYTEFGTGDYVNNEGVEEAIRLKRAKSIPWYIHISMVPPSFERYGYPIVVGQDGEKYYEVDGMHPKPYLYPAAFRRREENARAVADEIEKMLERAAR